MSPPLSSFVNRPDRGDQQRKKVALKGKGENKMSPPLSSFVNPQDIRNSKRSQCTSAQTSKTTQPIVSPDESIVEIEVEFVNGGVDK